MYLKTIPEIIQKKLSKATWSIPGNGKVYLTFDDGPSEYTSALLDLLAKFEVDASFFLLGERVKKYPEIVTEIRSKGHYIGNHGESHLDGWCTSYRTYLANVDEGHRSSQSNLYRPPFGRMTPSQWKAVSEEHKIIMWSIMPGDFDSNVSGEQCLNTIMSEVKDGSIIVLHDNEKSIEKVLKILPEAIIRIKEKGLQLEALSFKS